ncbi:NUDIX hydrolase [Sedimentibacter sp. zth1]|uniref:NUDIX hydrolase n=1 Tax=Sedimentibacter sp. zth1 TaxID=2816908 RepID=UPI001A90F2C3|nr:NUDIX hydrolase [Sedimentibacter sp. zth1]QSX04677.1 NUDIX hydrolase [Sedimentibacter sp. zth1]
MSDYIADLRKIVGHIPLILSTAGAIVLDESDRILLQHRSDNDMWGLPGGTVEIGETVEETAKREVKEETGIIIEDLKLFNIYSGSNQHYIYPNGDEVYFICIAYYTRNFTGKLLTHEIETKDIKFFDVNNLPKNISPSNISIIEDLKFKLDNKLL